MPPKFFPTPAEFIIWLHENHARESELLVGFYKKGSGFPSITWPESVDAALRFGWIDGVRRNIDPASYSIRFTPRKPGSVWSVVNVTLAEKLLAQNLLQPAGLRVFEQRKKERSGIYAFEQKEIAFDPAQQRLFRAAKAAWKFFQSQAPWYQRTATWWVVSAKRTETKEKRLNTLIADSAAGRTLKHLTRT